MKNEPFIALDPRGISLTLGIPVKIVFPSNAHANRPGRPCGAMSPRLAIRS